MNEIERITHNTKVYLKRYFSNFLNEHNKSKLESVLRNMVAYDYSYHTILYFLGVEDNEKRITLFNNLSKLVNRMSGTLLDSSDDIHNKSYNEMCDTLYDTFFSSIDIGSLPDKIIFGKSIESIAEIYNLTDNQKEYINYFVDIKKSSKFDYREGEHRLVYPLGFPTHSSKVVNGVISHGSFVGLVKNHIAPNITNDEIEILYSKSIVEKSAGQVNAETTNVGGFFTDALSFSDWFEINEFIINVLYRYDEINFKTLEKEFRGDFSEHVSDINIDDYPYIGDEISITENIINQSIKNANNCNVMFYGVPGTGKTELAYLLAKKNQWNMIVISDLEGINDTPLKKFNRYIFAQKILSNIKTDCVILFDEMQDLNRIDEEKLSKKLINKTIEKSTIPTIWTSNMVVSLFGDTYLPFDQSYLRRMTYSIKFEVPDTKDRENHWKKYNTINGANLTEQQIKIFAKEYETVPSQISNITKILGCADLDNTQSRKVVEDNMVLFNYGIKKNKNTDSYEAYADYDYELANTSIDISILKDKLSSGSNSAWSMCLYGAPGTGKSAFARHLAKELEIPVVYKRYSELSSMYVGGTEKKIAEAFKEAGEEGAMLIIDEADSFLRNRAEARNSWEVTAVNEMLTQMETAKHPFVCTTNIMNNLDEASMRRFVFKISFDWLKGKQLEHAIAKFFSVDVDVPDNWILSPGDLVSVSKQTSILGITDKEEIYDMLKKEFELKAGASKNKIGF